MQVEKYKIKTSSRLYIALWRLCIILLITGIGTNSGICRAATYLLVKSGEGEIYHRFQIMLGKTLNEINQDNHLITKSLVEFDNNPDTKGYDAVISAGIEASAGISNKAIKKPVIMSMLPQESYAELAASGSLVCNHSNCRIIYLDQPVSRQLRLMRLALPGAKIITVIGTVQSSSLRKRIVAQAPEFGFQVNNIAVPGEPGLLDAVQEDLTGTDILMAIPDPVIYNRNTARAVLLSTFNQRIPLFAYSKSFVRAGATFGIYSSPEDLARQVAELVCCIEQIKPQFIFPKYFTIDVNQHAAEALGISIRNAASLEQALSDHENK